MDCAVCGEPLSEQQQWRGNSHCSRRCARLAQWNKRGRATTMKSGGYIYVKVDGRWVLEHRHIMEQILKRPLERHEWVRHIDQNHENNDPKNLELRMSKKRGPSGVAVSDYHCVGCRCFEAPRVRYSPS